MAQRTRDIQTSWANGVISPRVLGRTELDKYYASAEVVRDLIVLPQGGLKRRPGTQYVADAMGASRLIPFVFSPGVAYIIELGNQTMRFYYAFNDQAQSPSGSYQPPYTVGAQIKSGGNPVQLSTPFNTASMSLWDIQYAQQGDIMYFTHPLHPVQKLERFGTSGAIPSAADTNWRLVQPTFYCPPTDEFDQDISGGTSTLTPGATSGNNINFTASGSVFLDGDVGKFIVADTQIALITSVTSATVVVANILTSFLSTAAVAAGSWLLRGSPSSFLGIGTSATDFLADNSFGVGQNVSAFSFAKWPDNSSPPPGTVDCFRNSDVGRYINAAGCISVITSLNNAHSVNMTYLSVPEDTFTAGSGALRVSPSAPGGWTVEDAIWVGNNGYPGSCAFFQNRLFLASTTEQPKTVWASRSDDYENFAKGTNEGDALDFTISGGKLDTIQWMSGTPIQGRLAIETDSGEYIAYAGGTNGDTLTPSSINVQPNSSQGGSKLLPVLTDSVLIYIQRYRTKVYEFAYNIYQSSFASKDLSLYAEHLTHAGIKETAWQQNPYKILWSVTFDGRLLGMTYDRTQDVTAWHEHRTGYADGGYGAVGTGDSFISVACVPNPSTALLGTNGNLAYAGNASQTYSSDLVWAVVRRTRNGSPVYTIELLNDDLMVDCTDPINQTSSYNSSTQTETLTNAAIGGRVAVATGKPGNASVTYFPYDTPLGTGAATANSSGQITYSSNVALSSLSSLGLPFLPTLVTRKVEMRGAPTIQGLMKRWADLWIRIYQTLGLTVNGKIIPFFNQSGVLPSTPADSLEPGAQNVIGTSDTMSNEQAPLTTDVRVHQFGWDRLGRVTITQPQPLPVTLLGMFGTLYVGDQ